MCVLPKERQEIRFNEVILYRAHRIYTDTTSTALYQTGLVKHSPCLVVLPSFVVAVVQQEVCVCKGPSHKGRPRINCQASETHALYYCQHQPTAQQRFLALEPTHVKGMSALLFMFSREYGTSLQCIHFQNSVGSYLPQLRYCDNSQIFSKMRDYFRKWLIASRCYCDNQLRISKSSDHLQFAFFTFQKLRYCDG